MSGEIYQHFLYIIAHSNEIVVKLKSVFRILFLLVSLIVSGCIDQGTYKPLSEMLPEPSELSDAQKEAYFAVDPGVFVSNPDIYLDKYIMIRGKVSRMSVTGGVTFLRINLQTYDSAQVEVYHKGILMVNYTGTEVEVYGIEKGMEPIIDPKTREPKEVPRILAIQIIPFWKDETVSSTNSNVVLVAESKSLQRGETWDMGSGYAMKVNMLDGKAVPRQVWITLERNGSKLDDNVVIEGGTYTHRNLVSFRVSSISDEKLVIGNVRIAS